MKDRGRYKEMKKIITDRVSEKERWVYFGDRGGR